MAYRVYISHSAEARELGIIYALATEATKRGLDIYIAERADTMEPAVVNKNLRQLQGADCVLIFATTDKLADWVAGELNALSGQNGKVVIPIVSPQESSHLKGLPTPHFLMDWQNPWTTIQQISDYLQKQKHSKESNEALGWLVLGGLAFLLLTHGGEGE